MAKYDGLIIPRSYNDYINKSDPAGVAQALQLTGVMDNAPTAQSTKPAKSGGIFAANAVFMASNKTLSGVAISAGSVVRVLFTAALTGSNATTGLTLTYNGNTYAVKVGKNGALAAFVASEISSGVFKYLQAYTTLELMFDGTQFIIMGNPVVISSADYTIYTDGTKTYKNTQLVSVNTISAINNTITKDLSAPCCFLLSWGYIESWQNQSLITVNYSYEGFKALTIPIKTGQTWITAPTVTISGSQLTVTQKYADGTYVQLIRLS